MLQHRDVSKAEATLISCHSTFYDCSHHRVTLVDRAPQLLRRFPTVFGQMPPKPLGSMLRLKPGNMFRDTTLTTQTRVLISQCFRLGAVRRHFHRVLESLRYLGQKHRRSGGTARSGMPLVMRRQISFKVLVGFFGDFTRCVANDRRISMCSKTTRGTGGKQV